MRILNLALKDISQVLRDKRSLFFMLIMPVIFTFLMGLAFSQPAETDPRLVLGWVNPLADDPIHVEFGKILSASDAVRLEEIAPEQLENARASVRSGKLAGLLILPADFGTQTMTGKVSTVTLITDAGSLNGQTVIPAVQSALTRVRASAEAANLSLDMVQAGTERETEFLARFQTAAAAWSNPPVKVETTAPGAEKQKETNPYTQSSPGMIVQFTIFGLISSAAILVSERNTRTLQRLLATSMSRAEILIGHWLAMFIMVFVQQVILVVVGQVFCHVDYVREPLAILLVMVSLAMWAASMGLLIGVAAKNDEQAILFSMAGMFLFSALGGAWFPLDVSGKAFSFVGHLTPGAWAMDGFQNIILRGQSLGSVAVPVLVLLGYTLLFLTLAVMRFNKVQTSL